MSSPRKRGCFCGLRAGRYLVVVFPAQAGVFPYNLEPKDVLHSLPRASGGVSRTRYRLPGYRRSSPRKRGCFCGYYYPLGLFWVFPAQAGVFLLVSACISLPRVFPAQAGVFLDKRELAEFAGCLPRASGGVSSAVRTSSSARKSSPRKRGCFRPIIFNFNHQTVFPAQAGVFLL